ncbi:WD40 repeat-containing protein [Handroanthus impetiginosus]|uniref:WD40 repeat-containing protein n=1 Tax=Handroanthus impetiginosus TaxID=429701 RepID=A0A2G9HU66_9LAMI|nr:WD40 repeat-containing protein [Handroanthus impetiginosus]
MLSVGEGEEVFFDAIDYLVKEDWMCSNLDYEIWLRKPQSVRERREKFLYEMGFVECSSETMEFEQITESNSGAINDNLLDERRKSNSEANCSVDYSDQDWMDDISIDVERQINENLVLTKQCEVQACLGEGPSIDKKTNNAMSWWRHFTQKMTKSQYANVSKDSKLCGESRTMMSRMRVEVNRKRCLECTAVYARQELKAHNGLIWTMKFSPDGQYLASGGADGIVCIWRVTMVDADKCNFNSLDMQGESSPQKKKSIHASVVVPEKIFHIEDEPVYKFHGHSSDVLDLAWSTSNHLLSSSMDKTVRLWQVGSVKCLGVFHHSNYVTCVHFNPIDENFFISGSIDGKVRIWWIPKRRVKDWANVRDIVTAVCYQPNGKGFVVGSVSGMCRFYELSGDEIMLIAEINIQGRKKSFGNRITGIQFLKNDSQRVMITSEDSKIRILDGLEVVRKYRGLTKSGSQTSASFTPSGRHIISVGEDSRIYLWNHDDLSIHTSKQPKSTRSCEHFFSEGVTVALPWSGSDIGHNSYSYDSSPSRTWDSERFSLANWFSLDGSSRASTTWPEEKLPVWDLPENKNKSGSRILSTTWGLVFVTANHDGKIQTFHNYGLPVRI